MAKRTKTGIKYSVTLDEDQKLAKQNISYSCSFLIPKCIGIFFASVKVVVIADYVANKSGSSIDPKDKIKVNLRQVYRGPLGFQYEADVTITREMGNCEG